MPRSASTAAPVSRSARSRRSSRRTPSPTSGSRSSRSTTPTPTPARSTGWSTPTRPSTTCRTSRPPERTGSDPDFSDVAEVLEGLLDGGLLLLGVDDLLLGVAVAPGLRAHLAAVGEELGQHPAVHVVGHRQAHGMQRRRC